MTDLTLAKDAAFWDRNARKYARSKIRDMGAYTHTLDRIRSHLSRDSHVLEIACGTASTAILLAPDVAHITATDISPEMVAIGRDKVVAEGLENVSNRVGTVGDADLVGRYDAVLALNALHLMPDTEATLAAIAGHLPDGGLFISKTPCLREASFLFRPLVALLRLVGKAPTVVFFRRAELRAAIEAAGFTIIETGDFPRKPPSHFVVARKARA